MEDVTKYRIQQIIDNGIVIQISLAEDVQTEPISQKQMILDSVAKKLDPELREQVQPLLEAILGAQPTVKIKTYDQTTISITMPKIRYERLGKSQVGEIQIGRAHV